MSPTINTEDFTKRALALYQHQYTDNALYRRYSDLINRGRGAPVQLHEIPFLPVSFFKTEEVKTGSWQPEAIFESSGTTGMEVSRHFVRSLAAYDANALSLFTEAFHNPRDVVVLALLPSYLERQGSSLVHMARMLIRESRHPESGFYLNDSARLAATLSGLEAAGRPTLLLGVTFALLHFAETFPMNLRYTTIMETGGMKGRRREWTRAEVHQFIRTGLGVSAVQAEYGMTELLSQAYSKGSGIFSPNNSLVALVREINDPLTTHQQGSGVLNLIDLANEHSCAFIATEDLGTIYPDGTFSVTGRVDHSMLRGCSLMAV